MEAITKKKYQCDGCGNDRPCVVETNQHNTTRRYFEIEELKCVLDETNESYSWDEMTGNNLKED
jgi:hypothetical protein